jgi:hypothetical protein
LRLVQPFVANLLASNNGNKRYALGWQGQGLAVFDLAAHPCTAESLIKPTIPHFLHGY